VNWRPANFWRGKRVFLTGHTGFKGAWLSIWLNELGAEVHGFSLAPPTEPSLFDEAGVAACLASDRRGDIRELDDMVDAVVQAKPDIVIHMAAQALVRDSYRDPITTYATNVMGTAHLLEGVRKADSAEACLIITTDKCYENRNWPYPYRETDAMGGADPYSASKACAELVTASYRSSFLAADGSGPMLASARAGNVIGGGDWATDRLVPDCVRAFRAGDPVVLRYPQAVRPWQHVLAPLEGYMRLVEKLCGTGGADMAEGWNFGPTTAGEDNVLKVAQLAAQTWGEGAKVVTATEQVEFKEAQLLRLDSTKARVALGWDERWPLETAVQRTIEWYRAWHDGQDMNAFTRRQIRDYCDQPS